MIKLSHLDSAIYINIYVKELINYFKNFGLIVEKEDLFVENTSIIFHISSINYNGSISPTILQKIKTELENKESISNVEINLDKYIVEIYFEYKESFIIELY